MFKLALVNPPKNSEALDSTAIPINLGILASFIRSKINSIEIKIIDGFVNKDVNAQIKRFSPDLVGITSTTPTILEAYKVADFCKKKLKCKVVMGGVHVSVKPDEALKHCDMVVIGEGELALLEIVNKMINNETIKQKKFELPYVKNLDDIPMLAYDLIDVEHYIIDKKNSAEDLGYAFPGARNITLMTSRGCPNKCIFCHNSWRGSNVRYNSAKRVVDEIEFVMKNYNIEAVYFMDDEFLVNKKRFDEIRKLMVKRKIKVTWMCNARADTVISYGMKGLKEIKESGGTMIMMGLESGNERVLKMIKSGNASVKTNKKAVQMIHKSGLKAGGMFIIGSPSETLEEMNDTKKFILENPLVSGSICTSTPYPGTILYNIALEKGLITGEAEYYKYNTNIGASKSYILCDTMPKEDFIKVYKDLARVMGEKSLYNRITSTNYPIKDVIKSGIKNYPSSIIMYPLRNPIKTMKMIFKIRWC